MSSKNAIKRIIKIDMKRIQSKNLNDLGIFIEFDEENIQKAKAMIIGPKDSVYKDGILFFDIIFPDDYPYNPPKVGYISRGSIRIHPNLYTGSSKDNYIGKVCLSILGTWSGPGWSSIMDITSVLVSIQSLLDNNPLDHEPGFSGKYTQNHDKYKQCVIYETYRTLIYKNIFDVPNEFSLFLPNIIDHYQKNKQSITHDLETLIKTHDKCKISTNIYRINIILHYKHIYDKIKKNNL